jgi:hypothetical protein
MALTLVSRHRVVLRALGAALFAHADGPRPEQLDALVEGIERHLAPVSAAQRTLFLLALDLVRWLPVLLFVAVRPFERLSVEQRVRLLERMDRSNVSLLLIPLVAFKSLLSMYFYEEPSELRAMGYAGNERRRWLKGPS